MIIVLMGVSGSGKTTVGLALGAQLGWRYLDADDFHPPANIARMRAGTPLRDEDRWPWLDALNATMLDFQARGEDVILGCSALKAAYRERIARGCRDLHWVHLVGDYALILTRLQTRSGHYMPPSLLRSQFDTLEAPADAFAVAIDAKPAEIAARIAAHLGLQ